MRVTLLLAALAIVGPVGEAQATVGASTKVRCAFPIRRIADHPGGYGLVSGLSLRRISCRSAQRVVIEYQRTNRFTHSAQIGRFRCVMHRLYGGQHLSYVCRAGARRIAWWADHGE